MRLTVNGGAVEAPEGETVAGLLARLGLDRGPVAVERNGEIVPRDRLAATALADGDRLEILRFVGGGAPPPARLDLLEALARTWRAFQIATDVEGILGAALEGVASVEPPRAAHALLAEEGALRVRASLGAAPSAAFFSIGDAASLCAAAFRDAAPAAGPAEAERRAGLVGGTARAYPLAGGRVHGVIVIEPAHPPPRAGGGEPPPGPPPDWPADFATSAGLALDTAVLYRDLVEALHHISLLSAAARRMQESETEPESLIERALAPAAAQLGWTILALYDGEGARVGGLGGPPRLPAAFRTPADGPLLVENPPPDWAPLDGGPVAAVPVRCDPVRGLLVAAAGRRESLSPGRVDLLVALADRLGLAVRDARLVAELRAHSVAVEYLNRELARSVEDLRRSGDLKSRFVSTVSHELRTPLASIRLHAETILDSIGEIDGDRLREFVTVIAQEAERLSRLIGEILDLSRLLSGRRPLLRRPVDLSEAAERVAGTLRPIADAQGVSIEVRTAPGAVVSADRDGAIQALTNVLGNAVKYTPSGGRVSVEVRPDETDVSVAVADTGAGIPPDHLPHVFEEFYKVDATGSEEGTGLGLAITKAIVEGHGGRVDVESAVGRGTTFTLRFPRGA